MQAQHSPLFAPLQIGPVTAKNRFYQVPHCCGMGHRYPRAHAAMREIKAEGGWAVVSTEETEIHPSGDLTPSNEQRIWDDRDLPALALMTEAVHRHGALAAIELAHNGHHVPNLYSRIAPLAASAISADGDYPRQARAATLADIAALRRWHRAAVRRAITAGFDIVYVYAGHHMSLAHHFLSARFNQRSDAYGGSLENRLRLTRELLEDALDEAAGRCAVAFRFAVDDLCGADGMQADEEGRAVVELLAELPDLWDVNLAGWENDSQTARFAPDEGYQEPYTAFVKRITGKPVVGVGRYTSPDRMAALLRRGALDMIGAARPSIADPFLPEKIRSGRADEIRECIGCNICVASDNLCAPIRCTQNPTMGEEWRRGWHPERIATAASEKQLLVVGAGPAGLECALQLGRRGYSVALAEAGRELGGRVLRESRLKGLSSWRRVLDYREQALLRTPNVQIHRGNALDADDVLGLDFEHAFIATGARWRRDGVGRSSRRALPGLDRLAVLSPDEVMDGALPQLADGDAPLLIFDDEQGYIGGVLADHLADALPRRGDGSAPIAFVTPANCVSPWTNFTLEQSRVQARLIEQGVTLHLGQRLVAAGDGEVELACVYSDRRQRLACGALLLVTERSAAGEPGGTLGESLQARLAAGAVGALRGVQLIGDALAPALIADAVHAGHLAARDFERDAAPVEAELLRREMVSLSD